MLLKRSPERIEGWSALIDAGENLGEGEQAEKLARQSLEQFPEQAEPHLLLARSLRAQGRTDEALSALGQGARPDAGRSAPGAR